MKWLSKNKEAMFGNIDFTSSMDEKRFNNNIKEISYFDWIWFNPDAFKLIFIGRYFLSAFFGMILLSIFKYKINTIILVILTVYLFFLCFRGTLAYNKYIKTNCNFWDLYIREYDENE